MTPISRATKLALQLMSARLVSIFVLFVLMVLIAPHVLQLESLEMEVFVFVPITLCMMIKHQGNVSNVLIQAIAKPVKGKVCVWIAILLTILFSILSCKAANAPLHMHCHLQPQLPLWPQSPQLASPAHKTVFTALLLKLVNPAKSKHTYLPLLEQ